MHVCVCAFKMYMAKSILIILSQYTEYREIMNINREFKDIKRRAAKHVKDKKAVGKLKASVHTITAVNTFREMGAGAEKEEEGGQQEGNEIQQQDSSTMT